jgi:dephospho-CoA kinase
MMLLVNSLQFEDYEVMEFFCVGESSCSDAIARCYLSGKPSLTIPCYGERRYGHAQDDEMVMAVPAGMMDKALAGMEELYRRGIRYPISYAGAELDIGPALPAAYGSIGQVEALKGKGKHLLLGVTGGIASGKTSVANMLEALGAPVIDFDILARQVVEPEEPAWKEIVSYFGEQVLQEDGTLDRKKISEIVFDDIEKRKKLESFTHGRIGEAFMKQVDEILTKTPDAVIQVVIPLLIETNVQHMFDKILVVYTSREIQIERLTLRDGISRKEAENIIASQLPIDEKLGYADFVVNNEETLDEARKQVEDLWQALKEIQKSKN